MKMASDARSFNRDAYYGQAQGFRINFGKLDSEGRDSI